MVLSVNTNLASLAARRGLAAVDSALATTVQRLSSGLRINGASDDAAGLAIASRLTSRVRGSQQAMRNVNDGLSLLHTADSALGTLAGRLQRLRELAVQARNGSLSAGDRAALDTEFQQQRAELDRVAAGTRFNGLALLDGSSGTALFQIGAGSADSLGLALDGNERADHLGAIATAVSSDLRTLSDGSGGYPFAATYTTVPITMLDFSRPDIAFAGGSVRTAGSVATDYGGAGAARFTVDGRTVTLGADYGSLAGVAAVVQAQLDSAGAGAYGVTQDGSRLSITKTAAAPDATTAPSVQAVSGASAQVFADATASAGVAASANTHAGFSVDGRAVTLLADYSGNFDGLVADIQAQLDAKARGAYRVSGSAAGLSIQRSSGTQPPSLGGFTGRGATVFAQAPKTGVQLLAGDLTVQVGTGPARAVTGNFQTPQALADAIVAAVGQGVTASINDATGALEIDATQTLTLAGTAAQPGGSLSFQALVNPPEGSLQDAGTRDSAGAGRALLRIDAAIDAVDAQRSLFGAGMSRFEAIVRGLQSDTAQAMAARGRLVDADMAQESAALSRQQVLQQAAQAMVAQANLLPQQVLSLLK